MSGESADVDMEAVNEWYQQLPNILTNYEPEDIFNLDETGLFLSVFQTKHSLTKRRGVTAGNIVNFELVCWSAPIAQVPKN